ncbi:MULTISPECIES: phosphonate ABC transporter ATP-binding protein [Corynebacterium]|uniref:Phosphonate transport system ATP-binding protein n=1 Tax=Corynebacterium timonense TaxID=441500 RepID=A0A1H1QZQ7_9CORY|nr:MULTISPECIES: phosphonate ABC transporter ATP-binding protein [Corynebacterium]WJY67645.1 Phosphate-import ATP-binding protein PhnC [Corynebacterium auris]SDS28902.1 phosphonate transport system ATP-binding protein [Corynebacterium timonense]
MLQDDVGHTREPWPIVLDSVSVTYPNGTQALKDVSLRIEPGEMVAVVGLSGSGKSTLIRTINGLAEPTAGRVSVGPHVISELKGKQLREARGQIGMIFQQFNLAERTDVYHNVLVGTFARTPWWRSLFDIPADEDKELALRCLDSVGMLEKIWARAGALSGGQKQRVAIARALTQQPAVMLADEPVASLDPPTAHSVMADLMRINREQGLTVLVNLHVIDLARQYTTRVVGLRQGELVYDGPAADATDADFEQIYGRSVLPGDMTGRR